MGFSHTENLTTGSFTCILWYREEAGTVWFCPFHAHYFVFTQISLRLRASAIAAVLFLTPNLRYGFPTVVFHCRFRKFHALSYSR